MSAVRAGAAHRRVQRDPCGARADLCECRPQFREERVHLRAVRRDVHLHAAGRRRLAACSAADDLGERAGIAGEHRRAGTVARRDRQPRLAPDDGVAWRPRATSSTTAIAPRPLTRRSRRLRRQMTRAASSSVSTPGDVRRGDLAHAVADHRVGHDAPRPPERGERDLHARTAPAGRRRCARASDASVERQQFGRSDQSVAARERRVAARRSPRGTRARARAAVGPCRATASPGPGRRTRCRAVRLARPVRQRRRGLAGEERSSPSTSSSRAAPTTARRCSWWLRRVPRGGAEVVRGTPAPGPMRGSAR